MGTVVILIDSCVRPSQFWTGQIRVAEKSATPDIFVHHDEVSRIFGSFATSGEKRIVFIKVNG
jgi:hypothetical protein